MQTSISMSGAGNGDRVLTTPLAQPLMMNGTSGTLHAIRQQSRTCVLMLVSSQSCLRLLSRSSSLPNRDPAEEVLFDTKSRRDVPQTRYHFAASCLPFRQNAQLSEPNGRRDDPARGYYSCTSDIYIDRRYSDSATS